MKKIAFWGTVSDAYDFVFSDLGRFFRLSGAWIVVDLFVFIYLLSIVGSTVLMQVYGVPQLDAMQAWQKAHPLLSLAYLWPTIVIHALAYTAFLVAWHRSVLLGERRSAIGAIRFRRREWKFLWFYLRIGFVIAIPVGIFAIVWGVFAIRLSNMTRPSFLYGTVAIMYLAGIIFSIPLARLTLGLPAIAIDETKGVWRRAWRRGRHNTFRIFFGGVVCGLPLGLLAFAIGAIGKYVGSLIGDDSGWTVIGEAALFEILRYAVGLLGLAVAVSFLSLSYRQPVAPEAGALGSVPGLLPLE